MSAHTLAYLKQIRAEGVRKIRYFHCDHFEPWRQGVLQNHADELAMFAEQMNALWYTQRLTLFYKPYVGYSFYKDGVPDDVSAVPGEPIGFPRLSEEAEKIAKAGMAPLMRHDHEIQLHVHHEGYTLSDVNHLPALRDWLTKHGTEAADGERLSLAISRHLEQARKDTGAKLDRWAFVHGNWALNGSDPRICRIPDEIIRLQALGCLADFTFPAGRRTVDPTLFREPYSIIPSRTLRCYDLQDSDPRSMTDPKAVNEARFFVWNSAQRHPTLSLDLYSKGVRKQFEDCDALIDQWICRSPIFDDALYIKTYAHSMHIHYFEDEDETIVPLAKAPVRDMFERLRDMAGTAGLEVELITAMEARDTLMAPGPRQARGGGPGAWERDDLAWPATSGQDIEYDASEAKWNIGESSSVQRIASLLSRGSERNRASSGVAERNWGKTMLERMFKWMNKSNRPSAASESFIVDKPMIQLQPIDAADAIAVAVMKARIAQMGETESGAYGFYKVRADRGSLITRFERELIDVVHDKEPSIGEIVDIGAGIGTTALGFAASGCSAVALEFDRRRLAAAEAIARSLKAHYPGIAKNFLVAKGVFPDDIPTKTASGPRIALTTNIMGSLASETEDKIIRGLLDFDVCYVDLQRFCNARNSAEEFDALLKRMSMIGLTEQSLVLDQGAQGHYYRLTKG